MRAKGSGRRAGGFTLIEMMATVSIMAILMSVAVPGMSDLLESQRLRSAAFDLISDLTLARNEALKRGGNVTIAPLSGTDWTNGWRVQLAADNSVLRERSPAGGTLTISGAPASLTYDRNGRLAGGGGTQRLQLDSSALAHDGQRRCVSIDPLGRARSDVGACS